MDRKCWQHLHGIGIGRWSRLYEYSMLKVTELTFQHWCHVANISYTENLQKADLHHKNTNRSIPSHFRSLYTASYSTSSNKHGKCKDIQERERKRERERGRGRERGGEREREREREKERERKRERLFVGCLLNVPATG